MPVRGFFFERTSKSRSPERLRGITDALVATFGVDPGPVLDLGAALALHDS